MSHGQAASGPMRPGLGSALFLAVMLGASGLTILRVLAVAALMPVETFAVYATITATAAFLGTLISFGAVEATIKAFPRLVMDQGEASLLHEAHRVLLVVARRALLCGVPLFLAGWLADAAWLRQVGIGFLFALAIAYTAIVASMQRAVADPVRLASGTALRSLVALVAVALAATMQDLTILLAAEVIAILLSCVVSERLFFSRREAARARPVDAPAKQTRNGDGFRVFTAFVMASAPFYLDRLYVTATMTAADASRYAVLAILLTGASLLVNTVAQRVGPDAIRLVHGGNPAAALRQVLLWSGISGLLWLAGVAGLAVIVHFDVLPASLARYSLAPSLLAPIAVSGLLLTTALLEFLAIALDRERAFQRAAAGFLASVLVVAALAAWADLGLPALMWLLAATRAFYAVLLVMALPFGAARRREEADGQG